MSLSVDPAFRKFVREMAGANRVGSALHAAIMSAVKDELQKRIKDQFRRGVGPDDSPHERRKDGKPALLSRKLGNAARARVVGASIWVEPKTQKVARILDAHQDGHVFPPRDGRVHQYRDRKGKLISYKKFLRRVHDTQIAESTKGQFKSTTFLRTTKTGKFRRVAERSITDRVKFGRRVLPRRPIRPEGSLTHPWIEAVGRGMQNGFSKRIAKYSE